MNNYFIIATILLGMAAMFFAVWLGALLQHTHTERNLDQVDSEQKDNGLLGRLIVENAQLRVRLDAIEQPHATYNYVCTHCSHMFPIGRNQEVLICPACGGSCEN